MNCLIIRVMTLQIEGMSVVVFVVVWGFTHEKPEKKQSIQYVNFVVILLPNHLIFCQKLQSKDNFVRSRYTYESTDYCHFQRLTLSIIQSQIHNGKNKNGLSLKLTHYSSAFMSRQVKSDLSETGRSLILTPERGLTMQQCSPMSSSQTLSLL